MTGLVLLGYVLSALGIPIPVRATPATSQPFPCQHRACGCRTAQQCWEKCCCFTHEQKLAWARQHGVEPPAIARQQTSDCCQTCEATPEPAAKPTTTWFSAFSARGCRGEGTNWLSAVPALPPAPLSTWSYDWTPAEWLPSSNDIFSLQTSAALDPPPRV